MEHHQPRSVRIFLASSAELAEHRDAFDLHVRRLNDRWLARGLHLQTVLWENFLDAMDARRLQDSYNRALQECDLFVMLFRTKVGQYTAEEFEKAFGQLQETGKPRIYTYFNDAQVKTGSVDRQGMQSLWAFQEKLKALGHFQTVYEHPDRLLLHFTEQLEKLYADDAFGVVDANGTTLPKPVTSLAAYLTRRAAHWREGAAGQLDRRFVNLTLMIDHGLEFDGPRHEAQGRYQLLGELLAERPDVAGWVLVGAPGSGKSTVLQHHELRTATAALDALETLQQSSAEQGTDSRNKPEVCIWQRLSEYDAEKSPAPAEWLSLSTRWPADLPLPDALRSVARVRFLLDGLNEIKAPNRQMQLDAVERWTEWAAAEAARGEDLAPIFSVRTLDQSPMSSSGFEVRQIALALWEPAQIQAYCETRLGTGNALWPTIETDAQLLEISQLPFNLWAQCELFRALGRAARDRAELMGGMIWQMLSRRINDPPLKVPGLLGVADRQLIASGKWKQTLRALPDREGCLVPWLDDTLQRMHRHGRQVSLAQSELLAGLPPRPDAATPEQWLYAVRSLQLIDEGGHDEFTGEPLLRCTHQLWQEFFAARGIRDWAASQPDRLPDLRPPALTDLEGTLAGLGTQEPMPGPGTTHWEEPVKLAVQLVKDPAPWIALLEQCNLPLAGRAALACRGRLGAKTLEGLRRGLLAAIRDPDTDLRRRIEAGLLLGELGDPRYEERQGPHGRYLWPRHWAKVPAGRYRIGDEHAAEHNAMPECDIALQAFEMSFAPVTNAEYGYFMESGGYLDKQWWAGEAALLWRRGEIQNHEHKALYMRALAALRVNFEAGMAEFFPRAADAYKQKWRNVASLPDEEATRIVEEGFQSDAVARPRFWDHQHFNGSSQPVVGLSLFEARAYALWLADQCGEPIALPTEAQWEAAARGIEHRPWPWQGGAPFSGQFNADSAHLRQPSPVAIFPASDTPDGITDLLGNVWEWTDSAYTDYLEVNAASTVLPDGTARGVARGGSWKELDKNCHVSSRSANYPANRRDHLGFRLVLNCSVRTAKG